MKQFIGHCLFAGMHCSNQDEPVASLRYDKESRPNFTAMMSRTRFTDILKFLKIDIKQLEHKASNRPTNTIP